MEGVSKKRSLEELSKDELVKKCRSLLEIAQRAKQAKDTLTEENTALKDQLKHASAGNEIIESLTQEKLRMVSSIDDLTYKQKFMEEKLLGCEKDLNDANRRVDELDNEYQSCKRQNVRLVTENEQLLVHLDGLESQIEELKAIGLTQQQQLLELEENNRILMENSSGGSNLVELQQMLSVSLEEVKKLKQEKEDLIEKMDNTKLLIDERDKNLSTLGTELVEKNEQIKAIQEELSKMEMLEAHVKEIEAKNKKIEDLTKEIETKNKEIEKFVNENDDLNTENHKNRALIEKLKQDYAHTSGKLSENQIVSSGLTTDLENINCKLREKLKTYHSKLVKFAGEIKKLKESRNYLLSDFKTYNEQVKSWQEQLVVVMRRLSKEINEEEFEKLRLKSEIENLNVEIVNLSGGKDALIDMNEQNVRLVAENKRLEDLLKEKRNFGEHEVSREKNVVQIEMSAENIEGIPEKPENVKEEKCVEEISLLVKELTEQKNTLNVENNEFIEREKLLQEELIELKSRLKEKSEELIEEQKILEEKNMRLIEMKQQSDENIAEIIKLKNELEELKYSQKQETERLKLDFDNQARELIEKHETNKNLQEDLKSKEDNLQKHKTIIDENNLLISELKNAIERLESEVERSKSTETKLAEQSGQEIIKLANENKELRDKNSALEVKIEQLERENKSSEALNDLEEKVSSLKRENGELLTEMNEMNQALKERGETISKQQAYCDEILKKISHYENQASRNIEKIEESEVRIKELEDELERVKNRDEKEKALEVEQNERIAELVDENRKLSETIESLRKELESWKAKYSPENKNDSNNLEEKYASLITENKELNDKVNLLRKEIEVIKSSDITDGESKKIDVVNPNVSLIDLQESDIQPNLLLAENKQLNDTINTLTKQIESLQSDKNEVSEMRKEIGILKEKLSSSLDVSTNENYAESETLSTSTISRTEEANRLKDLEGSWEERYGKLRTLAIKLKGKIRELTGELTKEQSEKAELQTKLTNSLKILQTTQSQCDGLQDEIESLRKEYKSCNKKIENLSISANKDKEQLTTNSELISKLKAENEVLLKEKGQVENWKKQVSTKVQSLKKELEANGVLKKDYEARIQKLNADLENKEKELKEEKERHSHTKNSLQESNNECKKRSVLNLEMQDYERSVKELTQKLEKKNELVNKLKNQIDGQKSAVNSTKEQNRLLEERTSSLEMEIEAYRIEVNTFKKNITELEMLLLEKESKIQDVLRNLEVLRSENEDLSTQLSNTLAEHQKGLNLLRGEKDHFRSENLGLEQKLRETEDKLRLKQDELESVQSEYQGYKVRAQSVLRQNQTRDVGHEEKLVEEAATLRAQVDILKTEVAELKIEVDKSGIENEKLKAEKVQLESGKLMLSNDVEECRKELEKLNSKYQQAVMDHAETVRGLKVHADTLSQCYRQQITEQEARHNREIIELQSKLEKGAGSPPDIPSLIPPTTPREEGEGSESVDSTNGNIHPLEKLLGGDQDQEISLMKKQLTENELKVVHLTALLADTEQDLAKHVQMNKVLKEEIRRQQRSVEREKHAENLEYMKNVVFKFITLSSGDERQRLVPVLNTILKLSPEETHKLNLVAKGDKSWSNYLPLWTSPKQ